MKKEERLNRLFGDIDDDLVADAAPSPIPLKVWLPRVTASAAAVALVVGLALIHPWITEEQPLRNTATTTPIISNSSTTQNLTTDAPVVDLPPTTDGNNSIQSTTPIISNSSTTQKITTNKPITTQTTGRTITTNSNENHTTGAPIVDLPPTTDGNNSIQPTTPTVSNSSTTQNLTTSKPTTSRRITTDKPTSSQTTVHTITTDSTGSLSTSTPTTTAPTENDAWYEPKWDEKPIWQKFRDFERLDIGTYTVHDITINKAMVEDYLEDVNLHGYDIYTETSYDIVGKVFRIKDINPDCAVALQYPGRTDFFPTTCSAYTPATLGQFIADLNLREYLRVGTVYHSYRDADGTYHDKEYAGLTTEKVWEMLLCDTSLPNIAGQSIKWKHKISIRIDMPLLGYENISITLSENGYLRTNLLDTEKLFYVGEDTVDTFLAYVENNCRLQKDDVLRPMPDDTNTDTTITFAAQTPVATGTTVWKNPT